MVFLEQRYISSANIQLICNVKLKEMSEVLKIIIPDLLHLVRSRPFALAADCSQHRCMLYYAPMHTAHCPVKYTYNVIKILTFPNQLQFER